MERNMRESMIRRSIRWHLAMWVCGLLAFAACAQTSRGNVIYVTTLHDTIGDPSGCSLKDAIFSSRFRNNIAIKSYTPDGASVVPTYLVPTYVPTSCVAGSGEDMIVLPNNTALFLTTITDDADNFVGPTATPMITSTITIEAYGTTLQWNGSGHARAFLVVNGGNLTIHNALIRGFSAKGGNGGFGAGGGGLGAGGAIYVAEGGAALSKILPSLIIPPPAETAALKVEVPVVVAAASVATVPQVVTTSNFFPISPPAAVGAHAGTEAPMGVEAAQ